jgi:large subunit ribosomal protein L10
MNLQQKEQVVSDLNAKINASSVVLLVDYQGCTTEKITKLRRQLKSGGANFAVVKNTLAKKASSTTEAKDLSKYLEGPTALIWADKDPVTPAKLVSKFAKDEEKFSIKAGFVDGQVVDASGVDALASLPSKEELFAKLLALMNAPATQLVRMLNAPASSMARLIGAWKDELEKRQG